MIHETRIDIKKATDIGRVGSNKYVWFACIDCGKERWVRWIKGGRLESQRCRSCAIRKVTKDNPPIPPRGENHWRWNGGKNLNPDGYILEYIQKGNPYYPMANKKRYVLEHRLVMARHLKRCLQSWEVVHHKNGKRDDNRIENLELTATIGEHIRSHSKGYSDGYEKGLRDGQSEAIGSLKTKIRLLRLQVNELTENSQKESRL